MRNRFWAAALAAMTLVAAGCGSGSGSGINGLLLSGATSGTTTKKWRLVSYKANANFAGTGADQPCPVVINHKTNASETLECGADETIEFRADGKYRQSDAEPFAHSWSLSGSEMTLTFTEDGKTWTSKVSFRSEGASGGKQRLRATNLSAIDFDGNPDTTVDGVESVLEEF